MIIRGRFLLISLLCCFISSASLAQNSDVKPEENETNAEITAPNSPPEENVVIETRDTLDQLFDKLRKEVVPRRANATAGQIWREWSLSGSRSIDLLMAWANKAVREKKYSTALDFLDQIVILQPDYAEGWNRRATVHYYNTDFSRSLADIEKTLALEPRHFGALAGLANILERLERDEEALETWYQLLSIYPANQNAQKAVLKLEEKLAGSRT